MKTTIFLICGLLCGANSTRAGWHELLQNGGFESTPAVWTAYALPGGDPSSAGIVNLGNAHTGTWYAYLGDVDTTHHNAIGVVRQVVTLPTHTTLTLLSLYINVTSLETTTTAQFDKMGAYLRTYPADSQVITYGQWSNLNKDPNGVKNNYVSYADAEDTSSYAGQQMTLQFYAQTDSSLSTTFRIDDVSLKAYVPDYTISVSAGANGSVTPSGNVVEESGQTLSLTATPSPNYTVDQWQVNGIAVQTGGTSFSLTVTANATVSVSFKRIVYTVTVSAGQNGSVNPFGSINVNAGDSLPLAATPAPNYLVDQWVANGTTVQNGGNSYTLSSVNGNITLQVSFKIVTHTLTVLAANGSVSASPQLSAYPHGGEITLTANPDPNYWLYDWRGDLSGVGNTLRFNIMSDTTVQAFFQPNQQKVTLSICLATQGGGYQVTIPPAPEMNHILQVSSDNVYWQNVEVLDGNQQNITTINPPFSSPNTVYCRTMSSPKFTTPPFLIFPVANFVTGASYSSTLTPVTSIFDHHGSPKVVLPYVHDGGIMTYRSQLLDITHVPAKALPYDAQVGASFVPVSNNKNDGNYFLAPRPNDSTKYEYIEIALQLMPTTLNQVVFNYVDNDNYLYYDGHPGYDYAVGGGTSADRVIAAAGGYIVPDDFNCEDNTVSIDHGNGYKTCYLHMRLSDISPDIKTADGTGLIAACVVAGQVLGSPGDHANCQDGGVATHLHFEVRRKSGTDANGNTTWICVDPYGFFALNGDMIDPPLWLPGQ